MQKLSYSVEIAAPAAIVWEVLWGQESYSEWTRPFDIGSRYEGSFDAVGDRVRFLSSTGEGMYSVVDARIENEFMSIRHLGAIDKNGVELPVTPETEKWNNIFEDYRLTPYENGVRLDVTVDMDEEYLDFMNDAFPRALQQVKSLSEQQSWRICRMTTINVYLNFDGNCEEAFLFYKSVFGGEFPYIGRFGDMPPQEGMPPMPPEMANRIMHVSLPVSKETILMGSDTGGEWAPAYVQGNNFAVSINTESKEEADRLFAGLSAGGKVTMPMATTFWGAYFGMFTDKFGVNWMVSQGEEGQG